MIKNLILTGMLTVYWGFGILFVATTMGNGIVDWIDRECEYTRSHTRAGHRRWTAVWVTLLGLVWPMLVLPLIAYVVLGANDQTEKRKVAEAKAKEAEEALRKAEEAVRNFGWTTENPDWNDVVPEDDLLPEDLHLNRQWIERPETPVTRRDPAHTNPEAQAQQGRVETFGFRRHWP